MMENGIKVMVMFVCMKWPIRNLSENQGRQWIKVFTGY